MGPPDGSTESISNLLRHPPILPSDIIAQVCKELFDSAPGPDQYDLSLTRVSPDRWGAEQRFWSGLTLVCRLWWEPATKVLYEHVVLRHVTQIAALARTLRVRAEDAGVDFGALVQRVTLHECVVFFPECNIIDEDIGTTFERCISLKELTLERRTDGVDVDVVPGINSRDDRLRRPETRINPMWIFPQIIVHMLQARGPSTLRKLDLLAFKCGDQNVLYNLISASPHLTSLAVQNLEVPGPDLLTPQFLEELPREIWQWTLPPLRSLTILSYTDYDTIPIPVLAALGRTLTYLHIRDFTSCASRVLASTLPALCPALEHLVLHPRGFLNTWRRALFHKSTSSSSTATGHLHFPRLRFLDVWITNYPDAALWDASRAAALRTHARAPSSCAPQACPGAGENEGEGEDRSDESRLVCVRDVWVLQTAWCVRPLAEWWLDEGMWLEDDSSDYVYESPSEDSAEGEEWDSDSGSELSEGGVGGL